MTLLSLLGVGVLLNSLIHHRKDIVDYIFPFSLSILAIILSWLIITTKFAIYYCRLFYDVKDKNGIPYEDGIHGGLIFPGTNLPCYLDFFYLAFTVSLGYSVSDVNANKTAMRGIIIVQSFFSFIFFSTVFSIFLNTIISLVPSQPSIFNIPSRTFVCIIIGDSKDYSCSALSVILKQQNVSLKSSKS